MATAYSTAWKKSKNPTKQRKLKMNAPLHAKRKLMAARLSKSLQKTQNTRSTKVRVGDKVKITRGQFAGKSAKVERVDVDKQKIYLTGIDQAKREGGRALYPIHPSNVVIEELNTEDKNRFKHVSDKVAKPKPAKKAAKKAAPKKAESKSTEEKK